MMQMALKVTAFSLLALLTAAAAPARAQDYPSKPIRIISDSAPGSAIDVTFRMVMDRVGTLLGQQIVPVDQPGASGAVAAHAASEAVPDGYTLFAPALSLFISLPGKADNLPLVLPRDFLAVGSVVDQPIVTSRHSSFAVGTTSSRSNCARAGFGESKPQPCSSWGSQCLAPSSLLEMPLQEKISAQAPLTNALRG